jgi:hypothetical protein
MFFGGLIPGSDSGKVEEAWIFAHLLQLYPRFCACLLRKNHLQESRAFWILFGGQKVSDVLQSLSQPPRNKYFIFKIVSIKKFFVFSYHFTPKVK